MRPPAPGTPPMPDVFLLPVVPVAPPAPVFPSLGPPNTRRTLPHSIIFYFLLYFLHLLQIFTTTLPDVGVQLGLQLLCLYL